MYKGHLLIVSPLYGLSMLDYLRQNGYRGYNLEWTRELSRSIVQSVSALHEN